MLPAYLSLASTCTSPFTAATAPHCAPLHFSTAALDRLFAHSLLLRAPGFLHRHHFYVYPRSPSRGGLSSGSFLWFCLSYTYLTFHTYLLPPAFLPVSHLLHTLLSLPFALPLHLCLPLLTRVFTLVLRTSSVRYALVCHSACKQVLLVLGLFSAPAAPRFA